MPDDVDYQELMRQTHEGVANRDMLPTFWPIYDACRQFTMTSVERMYDLYESVRYIVQAKIPGAFVECGVWRGGSCMLMAYTLMQMGDWDREIILYDTFAGLGAAPIPDAEEDRSTWWDENARDEYLRRQREGTLGNWAFASQAEVRANMAQTGYPNVRLVRGIVEETLLSDGPIPSGIALLRLDTDWKQGAEACLMHLYPQLARGGVLIVDDYGHFVGQRHAVDRYLAKQPIMLHRIDYSCRAGVKR